MNRTKNKLPLEHRFETPLDTDHRIGTYSEQLIGFSSQNKSVLFIEKTSGFMTRRLNTSIASGGGNGLALSLKNVLFQSNAPSNVPKLNRIDPTRDNVTFIANLSFPGTLDATKAPNAMDFHPRTGVLYAILFDVSDSFAHLATIDTATGATVDIGEMNITETADALAIDPLDPTKVFTLLKNPGGAGVDFSQADLYSVNILTGNATLIGDTGWDRGSSLAFDAAGTLYAVLLERTAGGKQTLVTINTGTGVGTGVGELFYEAQFPPETFHSITDLTFRRLSNAASEQSLVHHGSLSLAHEFGIVNVYEGALHPDPPILFNAMGLIFVTTIANTGAVTYNLNQKGADAVVLRDGTALTTGDILANIRYQFERDEPNTRWLLLNPGS